MNQKSGQNSLGLDACFEDEQNPIVLFKKWFAVAEKSEINDPNALSLATSSSDGMPSVRMVLLKGLSEKEHRKKVSQTQNPYYKSNYKASTVQRILAAITYNYRNHQLSPKSENVGKSIIFDRQNFL